MIDKTKQTMKVYYIMLVAFLTIIILGTGKVMASDDTHSGKEEDTMVTTNLETKIELDDTYMNVIKFGSGKKNLVILSGISLCGLEGKGEGVAKAYSRFTDDYTVYLFDRKKVLPEGYQVSDMAEDVYRVLNLLGVKEAAVYGVSQGGMMAQSLAVNHPELVKGLVICSSQARATDTLKKVAPVWLKLANEGDVVGLNRSFFEKVYSEAYLEANAKFLPTLEKEGTPEDCKRFMVLVQACMDFDITDSIDQIKCEAMVLGDENDHALGVEGTKELVELLDCPYYIYDQYSHAVYDEAPDIQDRIYTFLQKLNY